jgi:amidase
MAREQYRAAYAEHWNATATNVSPTGELENMVDVILCPVGPSAAPKLDTAKYWGYTSQWNLLNYPGLVFPVSKVDEELDGGKKDYTPKNAKDAENWKLWEEYGAKGYKDAPVSLQLVGRMWNDELVVKALEVIQEDTGLPFVKYV